MEPTIINLDRDTICAISSPAGVGGIAVIRVSGPKAIETVDSIWKGARLSSASSHTIHLGLLIDPQDNSVLDQAVASIYKAPKSFTGDDTVEISVHGSSYIQRRLLRILIDDCHIRLANPGEFTMRAFSSGKLSLTQAEAVADIIASTSKAAHRIASTQFSGKTHSRLTQLRDELTDLAALLELELDFSEEDVEFADRSRLILKANQIRKEIERLLDSFRTGKAIKEGIPIAITGPTNAGKSSLLNTLLDDDRAIVSDIHGTTRDTIEETAQIGDYLYRFIDTAGLRKTDDTIERLGIQRSRNAIASAVITLLVLDRTTLTSPADIENAEKQIREIMPPHSRLITLLNKSDLTSATERQTQHFPIDTTPDRIELSANRIEISANRIEISANTGEGIDTLRQRIAAITAQDDKRDEVMITNERHRTQLAQALESIDRVITGLGATPTAAPTLTPSNINPTINPTNAINPNSNHTINPSLNPNSNHTINPTINPSLNPNSDPNSALSSNLSSDLIALDLRDTIRHLTLLTGEITTPDLLNHIFSRFCVGK